MKNFKKKERFILSLSLTIVFITVILLKSSYAIEEPRILTIKNTTESLNVEEKRNFRAKFNNNWKINWWLPRKNRIYK